jgi:phage shock protein PspC (stress-responsive transcriptional regulator)/predicted membrane protein
MIAGVCNGIAEHFGIDPILVRIAFVVATFFGGAGLIAYVAAWLLIPEEGETTSIGERVMREHRWGRIVGFVLIAIAISSVASPVWWLGGHGLFAVLLIIGGLYLLSPGFSGPREAPGAASIPLSSEGGAEFPVTQEYAPPTPASPRSKRRGGLGAITLGLLFIGGGIVGLLLAAGNTVEPAYVFAAGLLIVGAALVVSTWFGRSFVLIPLGVALAGLMSISTVIDVPITGGVGDQRAAPFALADLHDEYHLGIGELRLDLSHLSFDRGTMHTVKATVGIGHVLVTLPRNATAELHGHAGLGEVRFLGQHNGGIRIDRNTTLSAGGESPPRIVLDVEVGIGQVEVVDAAA